MNKLNTYQILSLCGVPTLVTLLIALIIKRPLEKRVKRAEENQQLQDEQNKATMLGVQALLRDRLLQAYRHYIRQGWADYDDKQNVENMHRQYETLGPNNVMDGYHRQFMALPMDDPKEEQHHATA